MDEDTNKKNDSQKLKVIDYTFHYREKYVTNIKLPHYFRDDSTYEVVEILKILKEGNLKKNVNWRLFNHVYRNLKFEQHTLPQCLSLMMDIFKVLERYNCKDNIILLEIVEVLFHATHTSDLVAVKILLEEMRNSSDLDFWKRGLDKKKYFSFIYAGNQDSECHDYVWIAASHGNVDLLKLMLKIGMGIIGPTNCYHEIRHFFTILEDLLTHHTAVRSGQAMYAVLKILVDGVPMSRRRLVLVTRALTILTCMEKADEYSENYATCYKLLFNSIAEPYVSCVELTKFLTNILPDKFNHTIFDIVEKFKSLLPEVPEKSETRTLQHLCRVQIRQSLRQNLNLLHGVSTLGLPKKLQKYILLNEDFDYKIKTTGTLCMHSTFKYFPQPEPIWYEENQEEDDIITYIRNM